MPAERASRILFLFSDTGGGHRSAAEAIIEALDRLYGQSVQTEMVDFFTDYAPPPLRYAPAMYPYMVRIPSIWETSYRLSDGRRRSQALAQGLWPYVRHATLRLFAEHPADLIVSVHPLANAPALRALGEVHADASRIERFLLHPGFPVDIRHNAKIGREPLARWAEGELT